METAVAVVLGILATFLVSRHYYNRSTDKELSAFSLLASEVFAGIEQDVRTRLRFTFDDEEVHDLSQLGFLIANTGERGISGFIEPLTLRMPKGTKLLDASIDHRSPKDLRVSLRVEGQPDDGQTLFWDIPLLNKGEYFTVRLLIRGRVQLQKLRFHLLADDLPRQIKFETLPYQATVEKKRGIEWGAVVAGALLAALGFCVGFSLWLLYLKDASLFVLPWSTFKASAAAIPVHVTIAVVFVLCLLGLGIGIGGGLGEAFSKGPRFPLPPHVERGYRFVRFLGPDLRIESASGDDSPSKGEAA